MGMHYLFNCLLLCYGPQVILYRTAGLMEHHAWGECVFSAMCYLGIETIKMIVIATVPISYDTQPSQNSDPYASEGWQILLVRFGLGYLTVFGIRELLRSSLSSRSSLKTELRVLAIGLGWAMGHSISHYFFPLLPARGTEFKWDYIFYALSSNAYLFTTLGQVSLLWLS